MYTPQTKKSSQAMALALLLVTVITFGLTGCSKGSKGALVTTHHEYYPDEILYYVEAKPGEKLATRFLSTIDKFSELNKKPASFDFTAVDFFNTHFEPQLSFGAWGEATGPQGNTPFLAVIPVKDGVTVDSLAKELNLPESQISDIDGVKVMLSGQGQQDKGAFAIHDNFFLLGTNTEALKTALAERKTSSTFLSKNDDIRKSLGLLPKKREGTFIAETWKLQESKYNALTQARGAEGLKTFGNLSMEMQKASPLMVAAITVENDTLIQFDSFIPVDLNKIEDAELRSDVAEVYKLKSTFAMASKLPENTLMFGGMVGLGSYYDLYLDHIASNKEKQTMQQAEMQLKMLGLDLRTNIVGLLDGASAVGVLTNSKNATEAPDVLVFLNGNSDTQKTLDQFSTMAAQMTRGSVSSETVADNQVKVIASPQIPAKVAYSSVDSDTLVIGTQSGIHKMYDVSQDKTPALTNNKLYQELSKKIPKESAGLFYVDFKQLNDIIEKDAAKKRRAQKPQDKAVQEMLDGIEGLAGASTIDGNMMKAYFSIKLSDTE